MKLCPLLQKECVADECEWWAGGIQKCTVVALAILQEGIHDMGVQAYNQYVTAQEQVTE